MSLMKTMTYAMRQRVGEFSFIHGSQLLVSLYDNPSHHQGVVQGSRFAYDNAEILTFECRSFVIVGNTRGTGEKPMLLQLCWVVRG